MVATAGTASDEEFYAAASKKARSMISYIRPQDVVLDLGCGIGRFERFLSPYCSRIIGVDPTPGFIRIAMRENADLPNVDFRVSTGLDLRGVQTGSVNFLFSLGVFERLPKPVVQKYLIETDRTLTSDGRAYLEFLEGAGPRIIGEDGSIWDSSVYTFWNFRELKNEVERAGFILEESAKHPPVMRIVIRKRASSVRERDS